jgi:hypothetical protein
MFGFASYEELFCVLEMLSCYNSCVVSLIRGASSEMFLLLCYDSIIFLLQLFCDFAIIVQSFAMRVSGDFSGKVMRSLTTSTFFSVLGATRFCYMQQSGRGFCFIRKKKDFW